MYISMDICRCQDFPAMRRAKLSRDLSRAFVGSGLGGLGLSLFWSQGYKNVRVMKQGHCHVAVVLDGH